VFQRLSGGNSTKPPRLATAPSDMVEQFECCVEGGGIGFVPGAVPVQQATNSARQTLPRWSNLRITAGTRRELLNALCSIGDGLVRRYWMKGRKSANVREMTRGRRALSE
jgi:hypothetical protein